VDKNNSQPLELTDTDSVLIKPIVKRLILLSKYFIKEMKFLKILLKLLKYSAASALLLDYGKGILIN